MPRTFSRSALCRLGRLFRVGLPLVALSIPAAPSLALEPWPENPWYWSRGGEPVLLVGGSDDDNLFQWPEGDLVAQLDRLASAGGNVVRNTMSDRRDRGFEVYPFLRRDDGKYDLERRNPEYWERFGRFLRETAKRGISVQIEVWDRFDYTDQGGADRWQAHPYNPANNINYSFAESGFAERYPDHPGANRQPFFFTTPEQRDNPVVRRIQERFVEKMLEHTLPYDHVLYCIDNETSGEPAWGRYWAGFIKRHADAAGRRVMVTEMWDAWDLKAAEHKETFDHPEVYGFVDVSQNNHNRGDAHWENFLHVRRHLATHPRPMNTTKTYGADGNKFGHTDQDGVERFWRHLLAGAASARFHRPDSGLGLNDKAVASIKAVRLVEERVRFWDVAPAAARLGDRSDNEAFLAAAPGGGAYVLLLPAGRGGDVTVDLADAGGPLALRWIDIDRGTAGGTEPVTGGSRTRVTAPGPGNWAATLTPP